MSPEDPTPVTRVELKRVPLTQLVRGDELLRSCPLLRLLPEEAFEHLLENAVVRRFADRANVLAEGLPGSLMLWVLKGEARLVSGQEPELEFAQARKGDLLGEGTLSEGRGPHRYGAVALGELDVAEFPRDRVLALALAHRGFAEHLRWLDAQRKAARAEMTAFLGRW